LTVAGIWARALSLEVVDEAKLAAGREFNADVAAVGVDTQDRVYAFNRGQQPDGRVRRDATS